MKTVSLKLGNIRTLHTAIVSAQQMSQNQNKPLPQKIAYGLTRSKESTSKIIEAYEKQRMELLNKYGNKKEMPEGTDPETFKAELDLEPNGNVVFSEENRLLFEKDVAELLDTEDEVTLYELKLSEFEKMDDDKYVSLLPEYMDIFAIFINDN